MALEAPPPSTHPPTDIGPPAANAVSRTVSRNRETSGRSLREALADRAARAGLLAQPAEADWLEIDFDADPEPPDYMVDGLIERSTVTVLAADTGAGKTWLGLALAAAAAAREEWLGREVAARSVVVVDEENPSRVVRARLRALGMTNEHAGAVHYASRQGIALGEAHWNDWLRAAIREHSADLCLIDTAMAATNISEVNDNSAVVALYKGLRSIAAEERVAIVLYHHERKRQIGQSRDSGQATMGARQWIGQADTQLVLSLDDRTAEPAPDGRRKLRTTLTLTAPKMRDDVPPPPELVAITSEKDSEGRLLWARVESEGPVEQKRSKKQALADAIVAVLHERGAPARSGELADALGEKSGGTFSEALASAVESGRAIQVKRGTYASAVTTAEAPI